MYPRQPSYITTRDKQTLKIIYTTLTQKRYGGLVCNTAVQSMHIKHGQIFKH